MRAALGTLPWVEQASVAIDVGSREVRFNLTDKGAFDEEAARRALRDQRFADVTVKARPG